MARKPNYDFERRQREKAKAAKTADRVRAKTGQASDEDSPPGHETPNAEPAADAAPKPDVSNDR